MSDSEFDVIGGLRRSAGHIIALRGRAKLREQDQRQQALGSSLSRLVTS